MVRPPFSSRSIGAGVAALCCAGAVAAAVPAPSPRAPEYTRDVRPILARRCFACHAGTNSQGGLRLDRRAEALQGGDSGAAIVPGKSAESLLIRYVTGADPKKVMPPAGPRLTAAEIGVLRAWIDGGAVWPAEGKAQSAAGAHWAFRAPQRPRLPVVKRKDWARNPIDAFVLARLEREKLAPSPEADRITLIRRLSLDLLGLPPSPEEVDAFVADRAPDAYERLVDRLLASPHYGERWGRHWLDLARYADSDGYEKDLPRPYAYLYRDWVIEALNRDMPFDRFTLEQLAGDMLPEATLQQKIATGFHRNTLKNREGGADPEEDRVKATADRADTTGTVWLGLTVGCAQCHTHKYDPISHREYYGLYAFFNGAQEVDLPAKADEPAVKALTLAQSPKPPVTRIHVRGDFLRPGEAVTAHTPAVLPPLRPAAEQPTRLELARWLTDRQNPLTARVTANRAWQHLFGRGLVATPNDFGTRGERPSHPELLDWLAVELMEGGWSQKRLIRTIVTSATYRQSSRSRPELQARDPRNVLLARQSRFRPEAEIVRDLHLAASGLLNRSVGGPSIRPPLPADIAALGYAGSVKWTESKGAERYRRGMYIFYQRTVPYPLLATFDTPDSNVTCTRRERSNTPLQALTLLNDPAFFECAQALGRRVMTERPASTEERLRHAFRLCLSREPTPSEQARLRRLYADLLVLSGADPEGAAKLAGANPPAGAGAAETAAWVAVARTLLNLDEFVTRE